jgi:hypothetical protein
MDGMDGMDGVDGVDDDLDLEVSDLRRAPAAETPRAGQWVGAREGAADRGVEPEAMGYADADDADDAQGTRVEVDGMPAALAIDRTAWRPAARLLAARRARGYAVTGLVLLVCVGLLLSLPGTQQALRLALAGPTPTPTVPLAPGQNLVNFEQTAPWGRLTLDGTPFEPQFGQTSTLPRGRHTLTYEAAPWATLRCQLSVPAQQSDTCPVDSNMRYGDNPLARVIDLGTTPETLPEAQRAALTSTVAGALQANVETTAVPTGDHYPGADGRISVATMPLRASLTLMLNTDATRAASIFGPGPCVSLCGEPGGGGDGTAEWVFWAHVVAHLRFEAADGTIIDPGASEDVDASLPVGATWSGTWSVTSHPYPGSPGTFGDQGYLCFPTFQRAFPDGNPLPSSSGLSETSFTGPSDVEGCVEVVIPGGSNGGAFVGNANATPTPLPADAAIFIARFGIVLAGNDAAHAAQPLLPIASAHERALAQQWMAQPFS